MLRKRWIIALAGVVCACVKESGPRPIDPVGPGAPTVATIVSEAPDSLFFQIKDEMRFINARLRNSDGSDIDDPSLITWKSRDPRIASIPVGTIGSWVPVTAKASGTTWIVAETSSSRDSAFVRVSIDDPAAKPLWRFTVAVGARTDASIQEVRDNAQVLLNFVNAKFNIPGAFSGRFEFVLDSVFTYPRTSTARGYDLSIAPRSAQYLVLFDSVAEFVSTGGAYIGNGTIQLSKGNWMTDPESGQILTHELGHARGAVDIYQYARVSQYQGEPSFILPASIMEAEGGSWDAMSSVIIDHNGATYPVPGVIGWRQEDFPLKQGVRVLHRDGTPVAGAQVLLKSPGPMPVASMPVMVEGRTDSNGDFIPDVNVFNSKNAADNKAWCRASGCGYPVLLVEVHSDMITTYGWMSTMEAVAFAGRHPGAPYIKRIRVGDPPA